MNQTLRKSEPTDATSFLPAHLLPPPPMVIEPVKPSPVTVHPSPFTDHAVSRFNAPPYTLATLHFSTPAGRQCAILESGSAIRAVNALRARLTPELGASVAPEEVAALACLRRDLQVTADRLTELMRSIAGIKPEDVADKK